MSRQFWIRGEEGGIERTCAAFVGITMPNDGYACVPRVYLSAARPPHSR